MRIISTRALRVFAIKHPQAEAPLQAWRKVIERNRYANWAALKATFGAVDNAGGLAIFNIGGNKFRLIAHLSFESQILYIKAVLTHQEYDRGGWKS